MWVDAAGAPAPPLSAMQAGAPAMALAAPAATLAAAPLAQSHVLGGLDAPPGAAAALAPAPGTGAPCTGGSAAPPASGIYVGTVKVFLTAKGYGFITSPHVGGDIFFLRSELPADVQAGDLSVLQGRSVSFEVQTGQDGRPRGACVRLLPGEGEPVTGVIKSYSERHGYGFITTTSFGRDVHFRAMDLPPQDQANDPSALLPGRSVAFQVEVLADGKLRALNMQVGEAGAQRPPAAAPARARPGQQGQQGQPGRPGQQGAPQLRGVLKSYDPASGAGVLQAPGIAEELRFYEALSFRVAPGQEVGFSLQWLPDGGMQAQGLCAPSAGAAAGAPPLQGGAELAGSIKSFNDLKGFGFINVEGRPEDLYFQRRDLALELQAKLPEGAQLAGAAVRFRLEATSFGRWHARSIVPALSAAGVYQEPPPAEHAATAGDFGFHRSALPPPPQAAPLAESTSVLFDGAELLGTVKSFNEQKGYGFINVEGDRTDLYFQARDLTPESRQQLQQGAGLAGCRVCFWLQALPDGRCGKWRARDVGLTDADALAPPRVGKRPLEDPSELGGAAKRGVAAVGPRLTGIVKSFSVAKGFGFIAAQGLPEDVFFLRSELPGGPAGVSPQQGNVVSFELAFTPDRRLRAFSVAVEG